MKLSEPYAPRPIRCIARWEPPGWRLKVYSIAYGRPEARHEIVEAATRVAHAALPAAGHYGVGFLGVHDGKGAVFVFLDWWSAENELHHHVWTAPADDPTALRPATSADSSVCVWDLAVQWFERQAWVAHVLASPKGPDLDGYLALELNADV